MQSNSKRPRILIATHFVFDINDRLGNLPQDVLHFLDTGNAVHLKHIVKKIEAHLLFDVFLNFH
jgi:hypothetical protein